MSNVPASVTIRRVLAYVAAAVFGGMGAIFVAAGISFIPDHDGSALPTIIMGIVLLGGTVLLIVATRGGFADTREGVPYAQQAAASPASAQPPSAGASASAATASRASFERLVLRSQDVFATLRDIAAHGGDEHPLLAAMLRRSGIDGWTDAPKMDAARLRRNGRFWLNANVGELTPEGMDRVLAAEAALNIDQDVSQLGTLFKSGDERAAEVLRRMADLSPAPSTVVGQLGMDKVAAGTDGEWDCRLMAADFLENAPAPFRITFDMRANVAAGVMEFALDVPRPASFSIIYVDPARQVVAARSYAVRSALLVARAGFASSARIHRVVVACNQFAGNGGETVLRLDVTRAGIEGLLAMARGGALDEWGLPANESLSYATGADGWFLAQGTWEGFTLPELRVPGRFDPVEAMSGACPAALAAATGASTYRDLGINENGLRVAAWNSVVGTLGDSTGSAVSALVALRDSATDVTVVEAADRTSKALVEGTVDVTDLNEMASLFVNGSALDRAVRKAQAVWDDEPDPDTTSQALQALEEVLSPIEQMGMYLDDTDSVYRYFNSVGERFTYNRTYPSDARQVRLVPDSYYGGESVAARMCSLLGDTDKALAHADELLRIAPVTVDAMLVKVRILENATRIFEAADLLKRGIEIASTARDMAICHYRLAYMEWKLGRSDLAVACYQRSIALFPPNADQSESELGDLLESDPSLRRLNGDDEIRSVLEGAGIPYGPLGELRERSLAAAQACTDANVFTAARPICGIFIEANRDDALADLHRSLH